MCLLHRGGAVLFKLIMFQIIEQSGGCIVAVRHAFCRTDICWCTDPPSRMQISTDDLSCAMLKILNIRMSSAVKF